MYASGKLCLAMFSLILLFADNTPRFTLYAIQGYFNSANKCAEIAVISRPRHGLTSLL